MASFTTAYYYFQGETIHLNQWKNDDQLCAKAQTKYGATETVCRQPGGTSISAKDQVLAEARVRIKTAQKRAKA